MAKEKKTFCKHNKCWYYEEKSDFCSAFNCIIKSVIFCHTKENKKTDKEIKRYEKFLNQMPKY